MSLFADPANRIMYVNNALPKQNTFNFVLQFIYFNKFTRRIYNFKFTCGTIKLDASMNKLFKFPYLRLKLPYIISYELT